MKMARNEIINKYILTDRLAETNTMGAPMGLCKRLNKTCKILLN